MIKLPGLIDPHVHLRDPGQTHKEDFYTGTAAALAGGYTTIIDMPNNLEPTITFERLEEKIRIARKKIVCDVGFYFGSLGDNLEEFGKVRGKVMGLKLYLNETTGNFLIGKQKLKAIFNMWSRQSIALHSTILSTQQTNPILVHAEDDAIEAVIQIVRETGESVHFCHISLSSDLKQIKKAKSKNLPITCGVTPHHLFLTESDAKKLGPYGLMKPSLKTKADQDFLWKNIKYIDVIESDHAPHTIDEKGSKNPPYGVPGLETTLPLLLTAMNEGKITINDIIRLCHDGPARIFKINQNSSVILASETRPESQRYKSQRDAGQASMTTYVEVDEQEEWTIKNENLFTKCKWSPFDGWKVKGKVKRVTIRGTKVFEDGKILAEPGFGKVIDHVR